MKLAAATLFSLVAIATYALPAAHPENRVDMQYSAINEPIIVHLEKRAGDQQRFPETIEDTQKSADYKRRLQQRQNQQQRLRQQEEDQKQVLQEQERQQRQERWRQQQVLREQERQQMSEVEYRESKSREKALQDWKANWVAGVRRYDCRNGMLVSPQDFPRDKRPNLVGPSDKVVSQIGTTNKRRTADLARGRTLQQRQHQTQDQSKMIVLTKVRKLRTEGACNRRKANNAIWNI
ncbi:hypothetical protein BASA60_007665 [Batrachochytrium salamandrivorans]|nr:hypothetical protein BASA60_007665 [Batrachochytrium salamandrivorans]